MDRWGPVGKFYDLIQHHMDEQPYEVSSRAIARRLGVTQTTLSNWRAPKQLIERRHIEAVAELVGISYARALEALMEDIGYSPRTPQNNGRSTA
jgi:transcriptional regulator with XRE-family HTH domain